MTRKLICAAAIGTVAIGILGATVAPVLGDSTGAEETGACPLAVEGPGPMMGMMGRGAAEGMGPGSMGSMMGSADSGSIMAAMMRMMMGSEGPGSMMGSTDQGSMMAAMMMGSDDSGHMMGSGAARLCGEGAESALTPAPVDEAAGSEAVGHAAHHPGTSPEPAR